jgi:hypothetical protein
MNRRKQCNRDLTRRIKTRSRKRNEIPNLVALHHIREWVNGGETNIQDLVMLCRTHHRMIHQSGWEVRMYQGRPEFIPPRWVDPTQAPRRQPMLV